MLTIVCIEMGLIILSLSVILLLTRIMFDTRLFIWSMLALYCGVSDVVWIFGNRFRFRWIGGLLLLVHRNLSRISTKVHDANFREWFISTWNKEAECRELVFWIKIIINCNLPSDLVAHTVITHQALFSVFIQDECKQVSVLYMRLCAMGSFSANIELKSIVVYCGKFFRYLNESLNTDEV